MRSLPFLPSPLHPDRYLSITQLRTGSRVHAVDPRVILTGKSEEKLENPVRE